MENYEDIYKLCYVRRPERIIVELAGADRLRAGRQRRRIQPGLRECSRVTPDTLAVRAPQV
ncbi:MAG TPA: hypothetical protein VKB73_06990 [Gaiellaceae bacterium]|nr:hypothetical protein [Gaiellaceae bacterium]